MLVSQGGDLFSSVCQSGCEEKAGDDLSSEVNLSSSLRKFAGLIFSAELKIDAPSLFWNWMG